MTAAAKPEIRTAERSTSLRVSQGDVFADVKYIESASVINGEFVVTGVEYPLVVVLSQDCDLQQDYLFRLGVQKEGPPDKRLVSVLVAPLYTAVHLRAGTHLDAVFGKKTLVYNRDLWKPIASNQSARFHHIALPKEFGIPESVIDFKHYFSVSLVSLHERRDVDRICQIAPLHKEDLCQRFSAFLSRIAVPDINDL